MATATTAQPFWTSKTFWTMTVGFIFNMLHFFNLIPVGQDLTTAANAFLLILGIVFRWTADQPLTSNSAAVSDPPSVLR